MAFSTGSRLKPIVQHNAKAQGSITWRKDDIYICTQKWEKSSGEYQDKFCLAKLDDVLEGAETGAKKMKVTQKLSKCRAKSMTYRFKVCNLKGKKDKRLNYNEKMYVPRSCFQRFAQDFVAPSGQEVPLVSAAVSLRACRSMFKLPPAIQTHIVPKGALDAAKKPLEKPGSDQPTKEFDWDNLQDLNLPVQDVTDTVADGIADEVTTTTTTTAMSEPESTVVDGIETDGIVDEVIMNILAQDNVNKEDISGDLDLSMVDEDGSGVHENEDTLEQQDVEDEADTRNASLDLDGMVISQIRQLWKEREEKERANRAK
jgi:hypothetical protein